MIEIAAARLNLVTHRAARRLHSYLWLLERLCVVEQTLMEHREVLTYTFLTEYPRSLTVHMNVKESGEDSRTP